MEQKAGGSKTNGNSQTSSMFEITFLRHGESIGNAEGYFQGQYDFQLSEKGKEQVVALTNRWVSESVSFDHIISSPLLRAKETAEIINSSLNCPIEFDPIWMERDNGNLAGVKHEEAKTTNPRPDIIKLYDPIGKTGESEWLLFLRAGKAVQSLLKRIPGKYLIVSHGGILNKVFHTIFGIKPQANFQGVHIKFDNASFSTITYTPEANKWRIFSINDNAHLPSLKTREWPYQFTLLRHGKSEGNAQHIFQGQADFPLNSEGQQQTQTLANKWVQEDTHFNLLISSPLLRARQTAEIIANKLGLKIEKNDLLKEVDNGQMAGLSLDKIDELFPLREDRRNPFTPIGETGETWYELYLRAGRFLQLLTEYPPGNYLVVSHGGTINSLLWAALGIVPRTPNHIPTFYFENTAYATLGYSPEDNLWQLMNACDHHHIL
jgi:2,3-bisphosphoglycerate-dependent phosphoglycerate mutase